MATRERQRYRVPGAKGVSADHGGDRYLDDLLIGNFMKVRLVNSKCTDVSRRWWRRSVGMPTSIPEVSIIAFCSGVLPDQPVGMLDMRGTDRMEANRIAVVPHCIGTLDDQGAVEVFCTGDGWAIPVGTRQDRSDAGQSGKPGKAGASGPPHQDLYHPATSTKAMTLRTIHFNVIEEADTDLVRSRLPSPKT